MRSRWENFLEWISRESSKIDKATASLVSSGATLLAVVFLILVVCAAIREGNVQALIWPSFAFFLLTSYRTVIERLAQGSIVKIRIANVTFEIPLSILVRSVEERFPGERLSDKQWEWMTSLARERKTFDPRREGPDYPLLMPLRNAGLIRAAPGPYLESGSTHVEITTIGTLLVEAWEASERRPPAAARKAAHDQL